jgi:hypothetical protein
MGSAFPVKIRINAFLFLVAMLASGGGMTPSFFFFSFLFL